MPASTERAFARPRQLPIAAVIVAFHVFSPQGLWAQVVQYYRLDALGNIRAISDQNGNVIERHDYLPFGEEWCGTAVCTSVPAGHPKRYTGKDRDAETGFDYFGARYFAARIGRFTTVDPVARAGEAIENPQLWNRYAYSLNNPLRFTDPDGLWPTHVVRVHQASINRTLAFLPVADRQILMDQQVVADRDQTVAGSFKHAMRGIGQSATRARDMANAFVRSQLQLARKFESEGKHDIALVCLGSAMHTLQDATSPSHRGFQEWNGKNDWRALEHVTGELYDPGKLDRGLFDEDERAGLDEATRRAYDYFKSKDPLPQEFLPEQ